MPHFPPGLLLPSSLPFLFPSHPSPSSLPPLSLLLHLPPLLASSFPLLPLSTHSSPILPFFTFYPLSPSVPFPSLQTFPLLSWCSLFISLSLLHRTTWRNPFCWVNLKYSARRGREGEYSTILAGSCCRNHHKRSPNAFPSIKQNYIHFFWFNYLFVFCNKSTLLTKAERQNKANECKSFLPYIVLYVSYHFKLAVSKINLEITPFFQR